MRRILSFKKLYFIGIFFSIAVFVSCSGSGSIDSASGSAYKDLALNTKYNESIESNGRQAYRFRTDDAGSYTIALTNPTGNFGWILCSSDSSEVTTSSLLDNIIYEPKEEQPIRAKDKSDKISTNPSLASSTYYYIIVDEYEWNSSGQSNYTLEVRR